MSEVCAKCKDDVSDGVRCGSCMGILHFNCAGTTESKYRRMSQEKRAAWRCTSCVADTATGGGAVSEPPTLARIMGEIVSMKSELVSRMDSLAVRIDDFNGRLMHVEALEKTVNEANAKIQSLESELNTRDQYARMNNVELSGVPFKENENLLQILRELCFVVGYELDVRDIDFVHRVRKFSAKQGTVESADIDLDGPRTGARDKPHYPNIIVRFNRRCCKSDLISAVRQRRGVTSAQLGFPGSPSNIFVNEHLTPTNKLLFKEARVLKTVHKFVGVWVANGVIKARISSPRNGVAGASLPSARDVSVTVHRPSYAHDISFTVMLAVWGQFVDHDITATALSKGENSTALSCCDYTQPPHPECFPVTLDNEDPFYQEYNLTCMEFVRSAPALTCHFGPREQLNQATAFIDASTVYGFEDGRAHRLRTFSRGLLRMLKIGKRELLPQSTDPDDGCNTQEMNAMGRYCFETGDDRANENLHLTTMHLIWARQHNRIATEFHQLNPLWDDETLYFEARRVVGAQMQHIHYSEFLPAILGNDVMWALNLTLKRDGYTSMYDGSVDPSIANHFASAAFRFAHTLLPGLIHNVDASTGSVNYIHLHEMLFNPFQLYMTRGASSSVKSAMNTPVHSVDPHVTAELSNHLFEKPRATNTTPATRPGPCGLDLVSLNIQRGRDHGLPPYPAWREHCGFKRPMSFEELRGVFDEQSWQRISMIYAHVEDIDLYTGALAEDPRGRLLGPTLTCLIADQFLRLKVGDRFWYESQGAGFSLEQLTEIRKTTLAGVICANEPLLGEAQPRAMMEIAPDNPLVDCRELPQTSFQPWKV